MPFQEILEKYLSRKQHFLKQLRYWGMNNGKSPLSFVMKGCWISRLQMNRKALRRWSVHLCRLVCYHSCLRAFRITPLTTTRLHLNHTYQFLHNRTCVQPSQEHFLSAPRRTQARPWNALLPPLWKAALRKWRDNHIPPSEGHGSQRLTEAVTLATGPQVGWQHDIVRVRCQGRVNFLPPVITWFTTLHELSS